MSRLRRFVWSCLGGLERSHLARSLERYAAIDENCGRMQGAGDLRRRIELDGVAGANVRLDGASGDDARGDEDFALHLGAFADDQHVLSFDLAEKAAVDSHAPVEVQLPLEVGPATEQCVDFGGARSGAPWQQGGIGVVRVKTSGIHLSRHSPRASIGAIANPSKGTLPAALREDRAPQVGQRPSAWSNRAMGSAVRLRHGVLAGLVVLTLSAVGFAETSKAAKPAQSSSAKRGAPPKTARSGAPASGRATTRSRKPRVKHGPDAAVASYPSFEVLPSGISRVSLVVDRRTDVEERRTDQQLIYKLKGAYAPVRSNLLPLPTDHFRSTVGRVQLVEDGQDLDLVIDLRAAADASYQMDKGDGGQVLRVEVGPPGKVKKSAAPAAPVGSGLDDDDDEEADEAASKPAPPPKASKPAPPPKAEKPAPPPKAEKPAPPPKAEKPAKSSGIDDSLD